MAQGDKSDQTRTNSFIRMDGTPTMRQLNRHAQALGRLGKGRKKTMSKAALQQRQDAIKKALSARKSLMQKKYKQMQNKDWTRKRFRCLMRATQ